MASRYIYQKVTLAVVLSTWLLFHAIIIFSWKTCGYWDIEEIEMLIIMGKINIYFNRSEFYLSTTMYKVKNITYFNILI